MQTYLLTTKQQDILKITLPYTNSHFLGSTHKNITGNSHIGNVCLLVCLVELLMARHRRVGTGAL